MVEFGNLDPETGEYKHLLTLPQAAMQACPHFIMVPEHYREDGTCKCNDPEHKEMEEWGYEWDNDNERWT
jgi:hypothetical protein